MAKLQLKPFAIETLKKRYLLRDESGNIIETPEQMFMRTAKCVAGVEETEENKKYWTKSFYELMTSGNFIPNTPTLMNSGKENGQLSACFVLPIEDSMEGIFTTLKNAAIVHKTGGGTGFNFSSLRPEGAMVSNKTGVSTGPLAFCQVYNQATDVVKQGSSRRGANMMVFDIDHPDILNFIDMKMTPGVMTNFNVSVAITDEFMQAYKNGEKYKLRHPYGGDYGELDAREVFDKIAYNAFKAAEPGLIFIDRVNEYSPYEERIVATNPCGEQPLPPYGSCNLGAINLTNFVNVEQDMDKTVRYIDWERLADAVYESTRFLDNVIDANHYPLPEISMHAKKYRNIGLGIMGWADALILLRIPYTSPEALGLAEKVMMFINSEAHEASVELAREKGLPSGAPFPKFFDYSEENRRNATLTTIAPTGTTSFFAMLAGFATSGVSSGCEPNFGYILERHQLDTIVTEEHPLYAAAKNNGGVDKSVFIEAHEIPGEIHVDIQAAFQAHCDSAISKTINLHSSATVEDVKEAYLRAYDSGCKGITVYVDGSREGVLHRKDEPKTTFENYCTDCGNELVMESGCEKCLMCGWSKCLIA